MAKKKTGDLYIDVSANVARIQKDMSKITSTVKKSSKSWSKFVNQAKVALAGFVTVQALKGVANYTKAVLDQADAFAKTSTAIGVSTESLSAYAHGAVLAGTNQATLNTSLKMLAKNSEMAGRGLGEASKAFTSIGVEVKNTDGSLKSVDQLLKETADAFKGMSNATERAAKAQQIFGRGGLDMVNFLKDGSSGLKAMRKAADELGITISGDFARNAEAANDAMTRMGAAASAAGISLASDLAPFITTIAESFTKAAKQGGLLEGAINGISKALDIATGGDLDFKAKSEIDAISDRVNKSREAMEKAKPAAMRYHKEITNLKKSQQFYNEGSRRHVQLQKIIEKKQVALMGTGYGKHKRALAKAEAEHTAKIRENLNAAKEKLRIEKEAADQAERAAARKAEIKARDKQNAADLKAGAGGDEFQKTAQKEREDEAAKRETLLADLATFGMSKQDLLKQQYEQEMFLLAGHEEAQKALTEKYQKEKNDLKKKGDEKTQKFTLQHFKAMVTATELFAKKGTKAQRIASATNAFMKAHEAANVALASAPPPFGQIMAVATLAAGIKNAKSILSADGSGATSSPAAATPTPTAQTEPTVTNTTNVSASFMGSSFGREQYDQFKEWFEADFTNDRTNQVNFT